MCGLPASQHDLVHESDARRIYCACFADAATQCVAAHVHIIRSSPLACLPVRLSFLSLKLEIDDTFATFVKECASSKTVSRICKHVTEGSRAQLHLQSEHASAHCRAATPQWIYVNGGVSSTAKRSFTAWAEAVKAKICEALSLIDSSPTLPARS